MTFFRVFSFISHVGWRLWGFWALGVTFEPSIFAVRREKINFAIKQKFSTIGSYKLSQANNRESRNFEIGLRNYKKILSLLKETLQLLVQGNTVNVSMGDFEPLIT